MTLSAPSHQLAVQLKTDLTPQIKRRSVRIRPLRAQLVRELLRRHEHRVFIPRPQPRDDRLVEISRRVDHRRDRRCVVVDAGVHENAAAARVGFAWRREVVDAAGLNVDRVDFGAVVFREDREFDGAAP